MILYICDSAPIVESDDKIPGPMPTIVEDVEPNRVVDNEAASPPQVPIAPSANSLPLN